MWGMLGWFGVVHYQEWCQVALVVVVVLLVDRGLLLLGRGSPLSG
jgi:hypothetical protein